MVQTGSYYERKQQTRLNKERRRQGVSLGIDTVIIVDPFYFSVDIRKGMKFIASEEGLLNFIELVRKNSSIAGLHTQTLSPKIFSQNDVNAYNDLAALNDWISELIFHTDSLEMIPLEGERVTPISKKYNTPYFAYSGVFTAKTKHEFSWPIFVWTTYFFPLLPLGLYYNFGPVYLTDYYYLLLDAETGKTLMAQRIHLKGKANSGYLNSIMYDQMLQIKKSSSKKSKK